MEPRALTSGNRPRRARLLAFVVIAVAGWALVPPAAPAADPFGPLDTPGLATSYSDEVMADGPAGYWRLGEPGGTTLIDETGVNNGTYAGGVTLSQPGALPYDGNTAALLDGSSGRASVPDSPSLGMTSAVTVELWAKRTKSSAYQVLVGKPGHGQSKFENYSIWINTTNRAQAYFGDGSTYVSVVSGVLDTNWHHIVATYDNSVARLYIDGVEAATATSNLQMATSKQALNIGRATNNQYPFGGTLDEVAVYPTALSAARIQAHFEKTTVDTTPPSVTLTQPANGSSTNSPTPVLSGTAGTASGDLASVTLRIYQGAGTSGALLQTHTTTATPGGGYAGTPAPLADGVYTAQAEQSDSAGNTGFSSPSTFTVDTVAPSVSITSGPSDPTTSTAASLAFTTEAGASTECKLDAGPYSSCTSPRTYSALSDGAHTFSVRATDAAGNTGTPATRSWTVDTVAPSVTLTAPANGSIVGSQTPTLAGVAGTASGDGTSVTVRVYAGSAATGTPVQTLNATAGAGGSYGVPAATLPEGQYTARAEQSDAAGNTAQSSANTFTIDLSAADTTPPEIGLNTPANGSTTNSATPAFSGVAGVASGDQTTVTVRIHAGSSTSGALVQTRTATRSAGGAYTVDASPALSDGTYTAQARQSDDSGNTGLSTANTFTVDTASPVVTLTAPAEGSASNNTTPTFSGVAGTASGDASTVTVRVYAGSTATGTPVRTLSANRGADGAYTTTATALAQGTYTARTSQDDLAGNTGLSATRTFTVDTAAPVITLTSPANGSSPSVASPAFSGVAGTAGGDSTSVTVKIYSGSSASGTPVQSLGTTRGADGAYSVNSAALATGTYTARTEQSDSAGNTGFSSANTFTISAADPVLIGSGDIAGCETGEKQRSAQTAALVAQFPDATVFTLGDNAYPNGQPSEYANCYDPTWGAFKSRTKPVTGGHDTATVRGGALPNQGFSDYFAAQLAPHGPTATDRMKAYYSYDLGAWHIIALNAACYAEFPGCDAAAMEQWYLNDLAANNSVCTAVMWHDSRWSSGNIHGDQQFTQPLWQAAYDAGVDVVLGGHEHTYERFARQDANGVRDNQFGVRSFVVGTGGYYLYGLSSLKPNSEAFSGGTYGVLKLTLHSTSYDWQYLPVAGSSYTDSGSTNCHNAPAPPEGTPTVRSNASATAPYPSTSLTVNKPAGTTSGDVLLATIAHQGGTQRGIAPPSGWTNVPNSNFGQGSNAGIHAYYKVAGASEPSSYTFTLTGGSGMSIGGGVMAIMGADTSNPINTAGGQVTGSNTTLLTAPSITTTRPNTALIYAGAVTSPYTFTPPQLMPEQWDVLAGGTYVVSTATAVGGVAASGPTGTRTATLSGGAPGVALLIAVNGP